MRHPTRPHTIIVINNPNFSRIRAAEAGSPRSRRRNGLPVVIASESRLGRIKRAVRRQFILSRGEPILTRSVLERAYPRLSRFTDWHYLAARRALRQEAIVVARRRFGRGRPNLWTPVSDTEGKPNE
jgi:hypothetical protein